MRLKGLVLTGICASLAGAGSALVLASAGPRTVPPAAPEPADTPYLHGIDVARYQGRIDWGAVAGDEVAFAFIKATEGTGHVDPEFARNWREARRAGVLRGAYHYFTLCAPGAAQARHFLAAAGDLSGTLAPALDAEHAGPCRDGERVADPAREISDFMAIIERATGAEPILYTNRSFYEAHLGGRVPASRYWLRSLSGQPDFGPGTWLFWQHTDRGRRRGISGPVDLNAFAGSAADLRALSVPEDGG